MRKKESEYLKIYNEIKNHILEGRYKNGDKLPSKRQMAEDYEVSVITIEHSTDLLIDEGYVEARPRSGYYVCYKEGDSYETQNISDLSVKPLLKNHNISDLSTTIQRVNSNQTELVTEMDNGFNFSNYAKIIRKVINIYGIKVMERSSGNGCLQLREAISSYLLTNRGINAYPNQIIIGAGAEYLYGLIIQILGRNLCYGIEEPSYEKIEQVYKANNVKYISLPLGKNGIKSEALKNAEIHVLHISPYRSYPSGVSADASKRQEYIRWVKENEERFIIEDDFESEFYPGSKPADTIYSVANKGNKACNTVYLNTFSKTISTSVRIGYLVLPESLVDIYKERVGFYSCTVPTLDQYILAEYINSGELTKSINRARRIRRK